MADPVAAFNPFDEKAAPPQQGAIPTPAFDPFAGSGPVNFETGDGRRHPFKAGFEAAGSQLTVGLPYGVKKAMGKLSPEEEASYKERLRASAAKQEQLLPGGPQRWDDIHSVGDASAFLVENAAVSAPQMGATVLGTIGGAAAGGVVGGPPGAVVGGAAGAVGTGTPFFVGQNVEAATEGGQKDLLQSQARKSIAVAPGQAALDALVEKFVPGVGKMLPGPVVGKVGGSLASRAVKTAAGAAATEGVTEAAQQVGERYASEKDLLSPEAQKEYLDAGVTGAALGGVLGAGVAPFNGETQSNFEPDRGVVEADVSVPPPSGPPVSDRPPIEPGTQGDLFTLDDVLDRGIAPVETAGNDQQTSEKGAVGKYQLLPSTAKAMAQRLGVKFDEDRLLKDSGYNRTLAREYMRSLLERYDGDMFLAVTAYHAGEGNVDSWVKRFGYSPGDREGFLAQIDKVGNTRSAAYPRKVMAAMGRGDLDGAANADLTVPASPDDYDFSQGAITALLRNTTMNATGEALTPDKAMLSLSNRLSKTLSATDPEAATALIEREKTKLGKDVQQLADDQEQLASGKAQHTPEEHAKYQSELDARLEKLVRQDRMLDAASDLVQRYTSTLNTSQQDLFPPPATTTPGTPGAGPQVTSPAPTLITDQGPAQRFGRRERLPAEPQPSQAPAAGETQLAENLRYENVQGLDANTQARTGLLDKVLNDTTTRNPLSRFVANLKRVGLDPTPTAQEIERITEHENRFEPFVPDESGNFGIPERGAGRQPAATDQGQQAAEPTQEPATAAPEMVEGNVRTRAEARADQLGSSQRAWFLRGVDQAMGETETPAPTQPSKARWFKMGQDFVTEERAQQQREASPAKKPVVVEKRTRKVAAPEAVASTSDRREQLRRAIQKSKEPKGEPVTAKGPLVRGTRAEFLREVDRQVGQGISARQAQQLNMLEDQSAEVGGVAAKTTSTRELWEMLDQAVASNQQSGGLQDNLPSEQPGATKFSKPGLDEADIPVSDEELERYLDDLDAASTRLRQQLNRMGLHDVAGKVVPGTFLRMRFGFPVNGAYSPSKNLVMLAYEGPNLTKTAYHEAGHAMRQLDLFTPDEWAVMVDHARNSGVWDDVMENYDGASQELLEEEAVVESYARWADGQDKNPPTGVAKLFQRTKEFLAAIKNAFMGAGFKSAEDVFAKMRGGEVGARSRNALRMGERGYTGSLKVLEDRLPEPVKKARTSVAVTLEDAAKKGHVWAAFTEDVANMAAKFLPSAKKLIELHSRNFALSREFEERLLEVKKAYEGLPQRYKGTGKGSVSEFLYDSRMAGKWGFKPDYQPAAEVDPDLERRYKAMPKTAQDVIRAVFKFNDDARSQLYRATVSAIDAEYDPIIDAATNETQRAEARADKQRALAHFSRVFDTKSGLPYTPLKRDGSWVVVGRSAEYDAARKAGDQEAMDALRANPDHYFVDFRDTAAEAEALRQNVASKFPSNTAFERSAVTDMDIGGGELHMAFQQLKTAVESEMATKPGSKAAKELHRLAVDLYLHTLSDSSARKAELNADLVPAKDPVTGEVMDMMKAFVTRGQATTHYIASVSNNLEIQQAIRAMKDELSQTDGKDRTNAARMYNELMWRYVKNLTQHPSRLVDKITRGVSIFNLLLSPFYYLQNATQAVLISQPLVAAKYGYPAATAEFNRAYADFARMTKGTQITDRVDFRKAPADVRDVLHRLADRGRLDAGFNMELGSWEANGDGVVSTGWNKVDRFLRMAPQRVEVMNRVVTGIAAYRAAVKRGASPEDAFQFASKVVYDSHGDYSSFNAPRPFTAMGPAGKIVLQFRKFQFIMASLVAREFHHAFKGASKAEKIAGMRALGFLSAHMAAIGGVVGMPASSLVGPVISGVLNQLDGDDDKDYSEWKEQLRKFLGAGQEGDQRNVLADLLYKGAPYALMGADTSGRLGMGNMLAISPYSDLGEATKDRDGAYKYLGQVLSGAAGGLVGKGVDGWSYAREEDWQRAAESWAPGIVSGALKAMRQEDRGLTARNGDQLMGPEDISGLDEFYSVLGVQPRSLANQSERRSTAFKAEQFFEDKTTILKRKYTAAAKRDDSERMAELRSEWDQLQDARERDGFKRQPLSALLRSPSQQERRESKVVGGVPTTPTNAEFVDMMMRGAE